MNSKLIAIVIGLILLVFLLVFSMTYTLRFNEVAIVATFGEATADSIQREPGPHFRLPVPIQSVKKYDRRLQTVDTRLETHATRDGLQVITQTFVFWRIDPDRLLDFDRAYGSIDAASADIESRMRSAGGAISEFEFADLIGRDNKLVAVEDRIRDRLTAGGSGSKSLAELGVEVVQVGLSQVVLPVETTKKVVERMKKEKEEAADAIRIAGDATAQRIRSLAQQQAEVILNHAERVAARIRAQGDTRAASALTAMDENPDLAVFLLWLEALERSTAGHTTFVIPTYFSPFHLLDLEFAPNDGAIPTPLRDRPGLGSMDRPRAGERPILIADPRQNQTRNPTTPAGGGADEDDTAEGQRE